MILKNKTEQEKRVWGSFVGRFSLTESQQEQFLAYLSFLVAENKKFNITAITDFTGIVNDHFTDSLALGEHFDLKNCNSLIDVGTGGGLPGIPLKIVYPHLKIVLIEVNQKKATFLEEVAVLLGLQDVEVCDQDWRSFIRGYDKAPDLVVSRASLSVEELLRMFKPSTMLKNATLVYWASKFWNATKQEAVFLQKENEYYVEHKLRRLIFFQGVKGE
ncbi:16S rRNA (guanine(527)-N(7))-methyltransferase RsmG [Candidatus Babeliales bacterium]|nr:16S rRNA (guanine(527)-N(7))-methyltransferase RsmG [Candidatus Babeliales bacterium]MBP9843540.1 16S rRNA (guanine(527)-N(7))-methyltransferase RsmG [Candidatus Babeliales bacterium]